MHTTYNVMMRYVSHGYRDVGWTWQDQLKATTFVGKSGKIQHLSEKKNIGVQKEMPKYS